jgi:hypothetical protein
MSPNPGQVQCYAKGTLISTINGEMPIEQLRVGDLVRVIVRLPTDLGAIVETPCKPIQWIGYRHIRFADLDQHSSSWSYPVLLKASSLGPNRPHTDLMVSPFHGFFINGMKNDMTWAITLMNQSTIISVQDLEEITYFHIGFDEHEMLIANGVPAESHTGDRSQFDTYAPDFRPMISDRTHGASSHDY